MPKITTLKLSGVIMPESWNWFGEQIISLTNVQQQVGAAGEFDELLLEIDTDGGVIEEGWRVYDYLKGLGKPINTFSIGVVASMGTPLMLLGKSRLLSPHGKFIVHQPAGGLEGNINDFKEYLAGLESEMARLIDVYVGGTGKDESDLAALLADGKDHEFTAQQALDYGWTTGIYEGDRNGEPANPATASRKRRPIMAHLSEGRQALNLPQHRTEQPTVPAQAPTNIQVTTPIIDMTKVTSRLGASLSAALAFLTGKPLVNLIVDTADGKKLDIESTGDTYVIGDSVKYDDGSDVPDGDYILSDGNTITVAGGILTAIAEAEAAEDKPEDVPAPTAQVDADSVIITKAEFDRLKSLDTEVTNLRDKHTAFENRVNAVLKGMESKDPVAARLPETPIEKRTPVAEKTAAERKKERLEAQNQKA